jgi:hypothetical protein
MAQAAQIFTIQVLPTPNNPPEWRRIPTQTWIVGETVYLDLNEYVTDPEGNSLTFFLDIDLPPGVTLNGSVISGTAMAESSVQEYTVTADDGAG